MSLQPQGLEPIPQATSRLAHKSSPKGTVIMRLRDALGPIYQDEAFAELFPRRGRPAEAPWRLALVTVFQALENLSDRQAAQMVALRMDWKYALSLAPEDEGFDYSVLSQFRQRLIEQGAEDLVLEPEPGKDQDRAVFCDERVDKALMRPWRTAFLENELSMG